MARSDTLLTGSLMAIIAAALVFDGDEKDLASTQRDDELGSGQEETTDPNGAGSGKQ